MNGALTVGIGDENVDGKVEGVQRLLDFLVIARLDCFHNDAQRLVDFRAVIRHCVN